MIYIDCNIVVLSNSILSLSLSIYIYIYIYIYTFFFIYVIIWCHWCYFLLIPLYEQLRTNTLLQTVYGHLYEYLCEHSGAACTAAHWRSAGCS